MKVFIRLIGLLFVLSLSSCGSESKSNTSKEFLTKDVSAEEFKELIKSPGIIVDVRTPSECQNVLYLTT